MEAETVVYTAGTWDLFHVGHLNIIRAARELGGTLVVGVSTDDLVYSYKGHFPIVPYAERIRIIQELRCVDRVILQEGLLPIQQLISIQADILVLGGDWEISSLEGIQWMRTRRKFVCLPRTEGISTSELKQRIRNGE